MKKTLLLILAMTIGQFMIAQDCSELFISEYVEGSGNNKAIEIYNPTDQNLALDDYNLTKYTNDNLDPTGEIPLTGTIPAFGIILIELYL